MSDQPIERKLTEVPSTGSPSNLLDSVLFETRERRELYKRALSSLIFYSNVIFTPPTQTEIEERVKSGEATGWWIRREQAQDDLRELAAEIHALALKRRQEEKLLDMIYSLFRRKRVNLEAIAKYFILVSNASVTAGTISGHYKDDEQVRKAIGDRIRTLEMRVRFFLGAAVLVAVFQGIHVVISTINELVAFLVDLIG
ncbi:MAG: hypothetical protein KDD60_07415 [Bdellovibrionales bacterium]|nr:hypothetical protein [Bdellovibrionales bacterium]